jgi:hypothetical protein
VFVLQRPDCDGGTGYRAGDSVQYFANPAHGYVLGGWTAGTDNPDGSATVVVGPDYSIVTNEAFFNATCVSVTISTSSIGLPGEILTTPGEPNCGALPREWSPTSNGGLTGSFQPGTTITLRGVPNTATVNGATETVIDWRGLLPGEDATSSTTNITLTPGVDRDVSAQFGIACYTNISFPAPSGGTASIAGPNCTGLAGPGYASHSQVAVSTQATGTGYFKSWGGSNNVSLSSITSTTTGSSALLNITGDNITLGANYGGCVYAPVQTQGPGTASAYPTGNCPSQGAGWYTPGSQVELTAKPGFFDTFLGWSGQALNDSVDTFTTSYATVTADGPFIASFYEADVCVPIHFVSVPAGAVTITPTFNEPSNSQCPAGQYDRSVVDGPYGTRNVTFTASPQTPAASSAIIGFSLSTARETSEDTTGPFTIPGIQGSSLSTSILGETTVTATVCENMDAELTLVSPNGTKHTAPAPSDADFIDVTPSPNCPYGINDYVIGSHPVFPAANGPSNGYTFMGWSGAITSTSKYPTTGVLLDGSANSKTLTATYQVVCHTLTANFDVIAVSPAPNCPDAPASAHSYIAGTNVALEATGDGSLIFRGWTGNPSTTDNDIAVATMLTDQTIDADYTAETTGEKIVGGLTDFGNDVAVLGKKAVGVVSSIATALILGSNPVIALASLGTAIVEGVIDGLQYLGVSGSGLDAVKNGADDVASMLNFVTSATSCATVWSEGTGDDVADNSGSKGQGIEGATGKALTKEYQTQQAIADANAEAAQKAAIEGSYGADVDEVGATVGQNAGRLGSAATVGVAIYQEVTSGSLAWDSSATAAWTGGGDAYTRCMEDAVPAYLGLPPAPGN